MNKKYLIILLIVTLVFSCKKKKDDNTGLLLLLASFGLTSASTSTSAPAGDKQVNLTVAGLNTVLTSAAVNSFASKMMRSVSVPVSPEYSGIGINYGNIMVDGFKIKLNGITVKGKSGTSDVQLFDWSSAPRILEVAKGFNGGITDTGTLPNGIYQSLTIGIEPNYQIKAWAYLDTNNDDTVDTTIWTTATGIQKSNSKLAIPGGLTNYDYYSYGFLYLTTANSATNDTYKVSEFTYFPAPLEITDAPTTTDSEGNTVDTPASYSVDVRLDTFQLPKAWDGTPGTRNAPFDWGNNNGIPQASFFPDNQPNFALQYLAMFGFFNEPNAVSETYAISNSNLFPTNQTQLMTMVFNGNGRPIAGRLRDNGGLSLNQFTALFTETSAGVFSFGTGDGALLYNSDPAAVQQNIEGFQRLAIGDSALTITVTDGPDCASSPAYSPAGCPGNRTGYIKRLQRND